MGDIYRFAKQTLICLATEEVSGEGIEWIKGLPMSSPEFREL